MSCGGGSQNFRLLDGFVGWDKATCEGLVGLGFDEPDGVRLAQEHPKLSALDCSEGDTYIPADALLAYLLPPRLARGCGSCDWFLVYQKQLLRRDCCLPGWQSAWSARCDQHLLQDAVAVAARGHRVAVADAGSKKIWIWERDGERLIGSINTESLTADPDCHRDAYENRLSKIVALAFAPWGDLLAADSGAHSIWRFAAGGAVQDRLKISLPTRQPIRNIAVSNDCAIWVVTGHDDQSLELWMARREDTTFKSVSIEQLQRAFKPTGLTAANDDGFCIEQCGPEGVATSVCFGWNGEPAKGPIVPPNPPRLRLQGQLITRAIDSGMPRCRWHRVRVYADVPSGASLEIAVASSEPGSDGNEPPPQGDQAKAAGWESFEAGVPHPLDWQAAPAGTLDFLIEQPPGRHLYVRLRLTGDGKVSPVVRRVRLDFPRITSLELLPPVYRDNPEAEDFTERFLALFDAPIGDLDRAIERAPALLDPEGVPADVLPWLGSFLDLIFDPGWNPEMRRKVLSALPELYPQRGTITGLTETIKLIFGVTPAIQELATERDFGSVASASGTQLRNQAQLGMVRLFGKSRARFRLNTSALGGAPLRSYGNPDHDPLLVQAFRLRILIPPLAVSSPAARQSLEQLVTSQKPAHTVASIRFGGEGFILGDRSAVGVDTIFGPPPPAVLGKAGNVRLRRMSLLGSGTHGASRGIRLGETSVVGVQTIAA
jgi:phage tail-like protein